MKRLFFLFLSLAFVYSSCEKESDSSEIWANLKDNQTAVKLEIDGTEFYKTDEVFNGHLEIKESYFVMNYFSNYESNFILNFSDKNWLKTKEVHGQIMGAAASNFMFGKVIDKEKNMGAGYLLYDGKILVKEISKSKLVFLIEGKAKKYPKVNETDEDFALKALIVSKNPKIDELDAQIPN